MRTTDFSSGSALPARVGIDARGLQPQPTGLGNYLLYLLLPMMKRHPQTQFFLYSNVPMSCPAAPNLTIRNASDVRSAIYWLHVFLPKQLAQDRIDVFWGAIGYVPVLRRVCPTVLTLHDLVYKFAGESMLTKTRWNRRVFQTLSAFRASRIVAVSNATAIDVKASYRRQVDDVINPIVAPAFGPHARATIVDVKKKHVIDGSYLVSAATFEPRKNLSMMVTAYIDVRQRGFLLPLLVLVGGRGWMSDNFHRLVDAAIGRGEIKRLGFVDNDDLAGLYAGASASIFSSRYEGFGMPVVEAQLCGTAVIHGAHLSMQEAGGGLGVTVANHAEGWVDVFERLSRGEVSLTSRLFTDIANDSVAASAKMEGHLLAAASRSGRLQDCDHVRR